MSARPLLNTLLFGNINYKLKRPPLLSSPLWSSQRDAVWSVFRAVAIISALGYFSILHINILNHMVPAFPLPGVSGCLCIVDGI